MGKKHKQRKFAEQAGSRSETVKAGCGPDGILSVKRKETLIRVIDYGGHALVRPRRPGNASFCVRGVNRNVVIDSIGIADANGIASSRHTLIILAAEAIGTFETHKLAVALHFGVYNFVRKHKTLWTTPMVAAGVELERWRLERVFEMTADYLRRKEDGKFEKAFAKLEKL
jgi:hypothetical protein